MGAYTRTARSARAAQRANFPAEALGDEARLSRQHFHTTYDGNGKRVKMSNALTGEIIRFVYAASGMLIAEYTGASAGTAPSKEYLYGPTGLLATYEPNGAPQWKYLTPDHLGTPRIVTTVNGSQTAVTLSRHDYKPFGQEVVEGRTGNNYGFADAIRQRFTSYERDTETGLDFAQARYLSSTQGRFSSPDPTLLSVNGFNPQSWNRYAYVLNNPLAYVDPLGLWELRAETIYKQKDGEYVLDKKGRKIVDHVEVKAFKTQKDDDAASLAKQLGLSGKEAAKFAEKAGSGDGVRLSAVGGNVGDVFKAVESGLASQAKFGIEHPDRAGQGPTSADCSETACRIAYGATVGVGFSVQEADELLAERRAPSVQDANLKVGYIVRWADAKNNPKHFATFIFRNDDGVPVVFSKSGARGPYETAPINDPRWGSYGYGSIKGPSGGTGFIRP